MALESQPISIANVENGVSPFVHRAWAWNSTGTDRFTLDYPNENTLIQRAITGGTNQGKVVPMYPNSITSGSMNNNVTITELPNRGVKLTVTATTDPYYRPLAGIKASALNMSKMGISFKYDVTDTARIRLRVIGINGTGANYTLYYTGSGQVNELFDIVSSDNGVYISIDVLGINASAGIVGTEATINELKISNGKALPYTPSPSEDFNNAYPTYEGVYSDTSVNGSTDPLKYTWTRMRGEDGIAGKDGRGITNTETMYAIHTSDTTPPTTGWTASVPALVKGSYLWTRNVWTYSDNTKETGYSVTYIAKDGNNGTDGIAGKDGVGIKSTAFTYATSTNGTTAPTTGWTTTVPTVTAGNYLWTRVVWTYTDNTTETGYSVARWGTNGTNGTNGVSVTGIQVEYAQTDTATEPSTGWSTTKPSPTVGKWYWTRTRNTLSNGTYTTWVVTVSFIGRDAVTVSDTAPANPVKGTLWQTTTDPTVLEWNGTAWVIWGISIDNIVADNVIAENGVFQKITGVEIAGSKIIAEFNYNPNPNGTVRKIGTTTIENGKWNTQYRQEGAKQEGVVDYTGTAILNDEALQFTRTMVAGNSEDNFLQLSSLGLTINYGGRGGTLGYNDLYSRPKVKIPATGDFVAYNEDISSSNCPTVQRKGRLVQMAGAFKPTKDIPAGAEKIPMGILPVGYRPEETVNTISQASGSNIFLLTVRTDGQIWLERHRGDVNGNFDYKKCTAGAWCNIPCVFSAADV